MHGFPKIIGVLTHLDLLKDNKSLKKTKKKLKTRFWTEVYQVHKLLYGFFAVVKTLIHRKLMSHANLNFGVLTGDVNS